MGKSPIGRHRSGKLIQPPTLNSEPRLANWFLRTQRRGRRRYAKTTGPAKRAPSFSGARHGGARAPNPGGGAASSRPIANARPTPREGFGGPRRAASRPPGPRSRLDREGGRARRTPPPSPPPRPPRPPLPPLPRLDEI